MTRFRYVDTVGQKNGSGAKKRTSDVVADVAARIEETELSYGSCQKI
jgi:hypothetical protein